MSISLLTRVSDVRSNNAAATTSFSINKPPQATPGKVLLLTLAINGSGTQAFVLPAGFTQLFNTSASNGGFNVHTVIGYRVCDGSEPTTFTCTFNSTTNERWIELEVFDGLDVVTPIGALSSNTNSSAIPTNSTITTTAANSRVWFKAFAKQGFLTAINTNYPTDTTGVRANVSSGSLGGSANMTVGIAYQDYPVAGTVTGAKSWNDPDNFLTGSKYWNNFTIELKEGIPKVIDSLNNGNPLHISQSNVTIDTSGFNTITSITIDSVNMTGLVLPAGDGTFNIPSFVEGIVSPAYNLNAVIIVNGDTGNTSGTVSLLPPNGYSYVTINDISKSSNGYLKHYMPSLALTDQVTFADPVTIGLTVNDNNFIDVDGRIVTDHVGNQTLWHRSTATGIMTQISLTSPGNSIPVDNFAFTSKNYCIRNHKYTSQAVIISGPLSNVEIPISVTNGEYSIDSGSGFTVWTTSNAMIHSGEGLKVRNLTSVNYATTTTTTIVVGNITTTFNVNTEQPNVIVLREWEQQGSSPKFNGLVN